MLSTHLVNIYPVYFWDDTRYVGEIQQAINPDFIVSTYTLAKML